MLRTDEGGQAASHETPHAKWDKTVPSGRPDKAPPPKAETKVGDTPPPAPATTPGTGFGSFES